LVFPHNLHTNAPSALGTDLPNAGLKRFAAAYVIATISLCLGCAVCTLWKSIILGQLFCWLGLLGWTEKAEIDREDQKEKEDQEQQKQSPYSKDSMQSGMVTDIPARVVLDIR
jgi:predicted tellurium resistance membrane protein TerC